MLKTRKRWISLLVTLAMLVAFVVPFAGPASAYTKALVSTIPTIADDATSASLGNLTIVEDKDFKDELKPGATFTVTFPSGIKVKNRVSNFAYFNDDYYGTGTWQPLTVKISGDYTVDVTLPSTISSVYAEAIQIRPIVEVDGFDGGDIKVTVDGFDSGVDSGTFVLGRVSGDDTSASVIKVETIGESGKGGDIRITENSVGAIGDDPQTITLKLPAGFKWDSTNMGYANRTNVVSFLAGLSGSSFGASTDWIIDGRTFKFKFDPPDGRTQRGIIQITPWIIAESDADYGDVTVDVEGDEISDANDLKVAEYADFGIQIKADGDIEEPVAGTIDSELTKLYFKENVAGSFVPNRKVSITLPTWVKIVKADVSDTKNIDSTTLQNAIRADIDGTDNKVEFNMPAGNGGKIEFKVKFTVSIKADATGDIVAKVSGKAGAEGEAIIGKVSAPVTITATPADLKIGLKNQPLNDITITETADENLAKGDLKIVLPDNVKWSEDPKVEVTAGNVEIDEDGIDTTDNVLTIPIDSTSTKASTIKISGIKVDLDRTVAEGSVEAKVEGSAVVFNDKGQKGYDGSGAADTLDNGEFDQAWCAKAVVANVVTPAPGEQKGTAVFKIGEAKYTVNGQEYTMDVAPVAEAGRTYLPARFVANAMGVPDSNIIWDQANQTVTVIRNDRIVQMKVGSNQILVNGIALTMDVAPKVVPGRVLIPFRFLAQALGAEVVWDAADPNTITLNF